MSASPEGTGENGTIVQYIVLRRDLWEALGWPLGPVVAQGAHAATAALAQGLASEDAAARAYVEGEALDSMHKVVLEVKGETQLRNLSRKLVDEQIAHKLWVEQPEGVATALALKPYPRNDVQHLMKKLQLAKAPVGKPPAP